MATLGEVANYAEILGGAAVVTGIAFAIWQVHQLRVQRRDAAAIELINSYLSPEFMHAVRSIWALPEETPAHEIRTRGLEADADTIFFVFEALGVMVHERVVPLHILDHLVGMRTRGCWRRLRPWVEEVRGAGRPTYAEWFQWLADRLDENVRADRHLGAHVTHREWTP